MASIISLVPYLKIYVIFCFDVHEQNKTINCKNMGRAVSLKQSGKLAVFRDLDEDRGYERSYGN